jgi:hypothetical protein
MKFVFLVLAERDSSDSTHDSRFDTSARTILLERMMAKFA